MLFDLEGLEEIAFVGSDHPTGHLTIAAGVKIDVYGKRPGWFHRLMARWLLGWRWEDA